jgi:hypothetical protein
VFIELLEFFSCFKSQIPVNTAAHEVFAQAVLSADCEYIPIRVKGLLFGLAF